MFTTLPDIPEVHYIDTTIRLSKPIFSGTFNQYLYYFRPYCRGHTSRPSCHYLSDTGTWPYINHEIPRCVILSLLVSFVLLRFRCFLSILAPALLTFFFQRIKIQRSTAFRT